VKSANHPDGAGDSLEFSAVRLRRRGAILNAVARVTEQAFAAGAWRTMVPEALATLGRATGVSRVYVFERQANGGDHARVSQRFEWVADGIQPQIDNPDLQDLDLEASGFVRWVELLRAGSSVVGDIDEFPPSEWPLLEAQSIRSILVQPIFAGAFWWGFIGFDACEREQSWEEVEVDALRIASPRACWARPRSWSSARSSFDKRTRWRPSVGWPAEWPMISTTCSRSCSRASTC
jgi:hypothetical protein